MDFIKAQLRKQVQEREAGLTEVDKRSADKAIVAHLLSLPEYRRGRNLQGSTCLRRDSHGRIRHIYS